MEEDHAARGSGKELHSDNDWVLASSKMLTLALENYDHFQPQAQQAYLVGHQLALETARQAANEKTAESKEAKLILAYSLEAFAGHFLTDSFSAGHIRFGQWIHQYCLSNHWYKPGFHISQFIGDLLSVITEGDDFINTKDLSSLITDNKTTRTSPMNYDRWIPGYTEHNWWSNCLPLQSIKLT